MPIEGCLILPHGALSLTPERDAAVPGVKRLHEACQAACACVCSSSHIDLVLLITPHGLSSAESFGIYLNNSAEGTCEWDGDWKDFKANCKISQPVSQALLRFLKDKGLKADGITAFDEGYPAPLRWGEAIPLWFLHQHLRGGKESAPHIILSVPRRRTTHGNLMVEELRHLGSALVPFFENLPEKVLILISGDLAHKHSHSVPHQPIPFGEHELCEKFDSLLEKWASNFKNVSPLVEASELLLDCRSCGYPGFCVLSKILEDLSVKGGWEGKVWNRSHPTYYGMMAASYTKALKKEISPDTFENK